MFSNLRRPKSSVENELISRTDYLLQHSRFPAQFLDYFRMFFQFSFSKAIVRVIKFSFRSDSFS